MAMFNPSDPSTPGHYGPHQTALLLLDFHSAFVDKFGGPNALAAVKTAATMRTWAKTHNIAVIHCLIDVHATPYPTCKDVTRFASIVGALQQTGGEEPLDLRGGDDDADLTFTRKPGHVSALKSPGLDALLQDRGIKSLVLAGLSTSGCVMRTAIAATDAEYVVTVLSDACADPDQASHDLMVNKILLSRGYVVTATQFQEGFVAATRE